MLSFPEYGKSWETFFCRAVDELGRGQDPLLSQIKVDRTTHAEKVQHVDEEGNGSVL
jgi:hypothetical protein